MCRSACVDVALMALLVLVLVVPGSRSCPRSCNCYQANEVHCTFRSLVTIPPGLPSYTRRINLGFNSINRIHDSSLAGLKKAELLMLHSNDLHHLQDGVFRDMKSLQILKLSYNKLREISSSLTFSGLTSLLRLYLDHNLLQHIHPRALLQLPSLRLLRLQGNRLHQLHPHSLCTLSLLNTYYFSTIRHLDLSNNSLTTLAKETLETAPLLETLVLQANPWNCDCRMNWFLSWNLAHPGLMKCPSGPQCPTCASPHSLQGQGLLDQTDLSCASPFIPFPGRKTPVETELNEIQSSETFREPLGSAFVDLSDQQGNSVDLRCNITISSESQDIGPPTDLSPSSPISLALSVSLECPVERESYETLWRILAYYSETAVRLEREIMLTKAPDLAYLYKQATETDGYYHTGVKASVKVRPQWLLQPVISIQLNRAQSNGRIVSLIYSTRVSTHPGPTSYPSTSSHASHQWVLISTNHTITAMAAVSGSKVELSCPIMTSGNPKVQWILPDGSKLVSPSNSPDGRLQVSTTTLLLQKLQLSDAGLYYCVAQAGMDVDILPLRLAVEESAVPPSGEQVGPPVIGIVGESVSLPCKASGSPAPYTSWVLPDGSILQSGLVVSGGLTMSPNGSLSLPNPSLRDAGHYRCIAVNHYGSDALSMQLVLKPQHPPVLKTSFPRGPQSAAGRSTKIRAPLLHQLEEGSGYEEEEEERTPPGNKRNPRPHQRPSNRRYPLGKPRRRGPVRGPPNREGRPISSTDQRRHRFDNRNRITANKQRIDPQKWADILAKIRQKTAHNINSQPITAGEPSAGPVGGSRDKDTTRDEGVVDRERSRAEGAGTEAETEGSSVDDNVLEEEGLQPIYPVLIETQTHQESKTNIQPERRESSTETQTNTETKIPMQTQSPHPQTELVTNPVRQTESVTSKPVSGNNEIVPEPAEENDSEAKPNTSRIRLQKPRQRLLPNMAPNSRPQSPWNTRRRTGQQRRIINRPRVQPLIPPRPLPDPTHQRSQRPTPDTTTDQRDMLLLLSTASPSTLLTRNDHTKTTPSGVAITLPSTPAYSLGVVNSVTPTLAPSHGNPHIYVVTHAADISDTTASTILFTETPAPTHSVAISQKHVPDTHTGTLTHGIQTDSKTHTDSGKHVDRPPSKHSEEQERNLLGVSYESHFTTLSPTHSSVVSSTVSSAAIETTAKTATFPVTLENIPKYFTSLAGRTTSTSTIITSEDRLPTLPTTLTPVTVNPVIPSTVSTVITTSSMARSTSTTSSTTTAATPIPTSTTPATTSSTTTTATTASTTKSLINIILKNPNQSSTTTAIITGAKSTTLAKMSPTTTRAQKVITASTTTTTTASVTSTSTRASVRERPSVGHVDNRGRPVPGAPNQSRSPTDWKNPGANFIPDSHSSKPHRTPSLPAVPGGQVVKSRPRIADPHIRTVSFPAESTAWLACEAQGEPKPSITWTKVSTGAVMSIHSKAHRFEVFPNGTLVIQNVQLQDRGTYICSAHSYLGRDRLLTTLEVWTRPPRMQLASYREATIHQGGEVILECQADGVPTPLLSWVLPDRSVLTSVAPSASRIFMNTNGTLHILATLPRDRGVYRCVASNSAGAASSSVRVHVSSLPPVIQQSREEHLVLALGMPVYAHCSARGAPPPTLRWRIPDGTLVRPSQFLHGNLFVLPNGTLHIRQVGLKDSGSYECTASNAVGADKRTVIVKTNREAEGSIKEGGTGKEKTVAIEKQSLSQIVNKDRTLTSPSHPINPFNYPNISPPSLADRSKTLQVIPSSSHAPLYPHQPSSTNSPEKIHKTDTASHTNFTNMNKTKHFSFSSPSRLPPENTRISPSIVNTRVTSSPSDNSRASAVVHPLPVPFSKARIVSTSPSITTVRYGGTVQLHCSVTGNPAPIIIWRTSNRKLVDMHFSFDRRLKVHPNGTLSVQAVTEKDAGDYHCIARNKVADDYRLLRVSVATKPAKIEPKYPLNQMVSFGKPLKVDCQASGLPDPAVHWTLPDGTTVNSVLQGEERGGRVRRLTVFDNGTLLVPAVGMGEEGEYTCYAQNQGGQDTMKVKVKVMMTSPPTFMHKKSYHVLKVRQGATATIRCPAIGDPAPTVTWFSPTSRIIPRSLGSGYYSERVVVVSDGTLEVRLAQKIDTGNYTCRASNSAGESRMVVGLEVEPFHYAINGQVGGRSTNNINNAGITQFGFTNGASSNLGSKTITKNGYSDKNSNNNTESNIGINAATTGSKPAHRTDSQNGFNRPGTGITTQFGRNIFSAGVSSVRNMGITADNTGIHRHGPGIVGTITNNVGNSYSTDKSESIEKNPGSNYNEVTAGKASNDDSSSRNNGRISTLSRNVGVSSSATNSQAGPGTSLRENWISPSSYTSTHNSTNAVVGGVVTVKQQAVKGHTVLLPCPSQGSPPPRLAWLLPGNGVLPAPYYGSRITVHRNGSLELRGVRVTDAGTLVCVVRGEREEARLQVELEVSEPQKEVRYPHRGPVVDRPVQGTVGLIEAPQSGASLDSAHSLSSVLHEKLHPRIQLTPKPVQRGLSLPAAPRPLGPPPPRSAGPVSEPAVSTTTASLVSIINGETLRLSCPAPQIPGSFSWTMPSGKVLSRGESSDSGRYSVKEDGTLTVQQASVFDRGAYTCRSASYDSTSVSVLTVPVIIIAYPPRITKGPAHVTYTRPGVAVELPCLTIATPRATVTWETPDLMQLRVMGQARIYGNLYLSPQGSLVIQNPTSRDTGFYRCTANNVIGEDTKTTYLHVI